MSVTQVGETRSAVDTGTSTITLTKPTGVASGDFLIFLVNFVDGNTLNTPSGLTLVSSLNSASGVVRNNFYWKVATGSEPSNYTFSMSTSGLIINGGMLALRDSDGVQLELDSHGGVAATSTAQNYSTPGCTQVKPGRVFHYRAARFSDDDPVPTFSLSGWTEKWDIESGGTPNYAQAFYMGFADDTPVGAEAGVQINASKTPTHNIARTFVIAPQSVPVNANAGLASVSVSSPASSIQSSGNFPAGHGAATVAANNATALVGGLAGNAPLQTVIGLASTWSIVPTTDPAAVAYNVSAAIGGEVAEEARLTAQAEDGVGYYGAPTKRRAIVKADNRTYTIPRIR